MPLFKLAHYCNYQLGQSAYLELRGSTADEVSTGSGSMKGSSTGVEQLTEEPTRSLTLPVLTSLILRKRANASNSSDFLWIQTVNDCDYVNNHQAAVQDDCQSAGDDSSQGSLPSADTLRILLHLGQSNCAENDRDNCGNWPETADAGNTDDH